MHVNSQWDADYKELDDAFQQYRYDAQKAQSSKQAVIDKLKHQRDALTREVASLRDELNKCHKKIHSLRKSSDYTQRIKELEDEVTLLRQQVSTTHTHYHTYTQLQCTCTHCVICIIVFWRTIDLCVSINNLSLEAYVHVYVCVVGCNVL